MKSLNTLSRLGRALQWFTVIWIFQLLFWALYVWFFRDGDPGAHSFFSLFSQLLQDYGWMPMAAGTALRMGCSPWMPEPTGRRGPEPQPGGTY
ncbi:hypothetical protein HKX54_03625 [Sulfitobacter sp. M57]|uniref:hypothetical protein n=1 Tax=unclassified Sulfitobacter TaxID=196795 RepID=UPI0023E17C76|nr:MULTISPECIES: hypothetical protein [unclassified Sulfitobacter]MDF3413533.1 hypothetical protein [Sulfitobacter sp. KE5]MDF3421185.1 hypothetical protein [Sulfitobacter sp. KE43]MDF3432080.1 hypothetical protein [Sulfitobacter sp. KE42]MDF3457720.1 hypothetical protein [Sulfitobacter sp. S74]MDF3461622.1 hypothetical protein [Sulfitobacter sp. Ks18]